jgi:ABC-2 type transport system ATP-binding protein
MGDRTIITERLVKRYKDFAAVDGISLKVEAGEIFGFLGPNGAGKSTTVSILTTLAQPSDGRALIGGYDVVKEAEQVRQVTGVALQQVGLDPLMKSRELLNIQGQMYGYSPKQARKRTDELLELVKLTEFTNRPVGKYSGGMRRRLDLAMALVHEPEILFLDEPTTGLDPASRRDVWDEVRRLNTERGMTIFLTTQYLEEADELAGRIAIIDGGKLVAEGSPDALKAELGAESINLSFRDTETAETAARELEGEAQRIQLDGTVLRLYLPHAAGAVPGVVTRLEQQGLKLVSLTLTQPTLDDVYLRVTGQRFQEEAQKAA